MKPTDKERIGLCTLSIAAICGLIALIINSRTNTPPIPTTDTLHQVVHDTIIIAPKTPKKPKLPKKKTPPQPPRNHLGESF